MLWDSQARASQSLKPVCCRAQAQREEKPPLTTAGESPRAETDTQCSQKINRKFFKNSPFEKEKKMPQRTRWEVHLPSLPSAARRGPGLPVLEVLAAGGSFQTTWHVEGLPVLVAWTPGMLGRKEALVKHSASTCKLAHGHPSPCKFIPGSKKRN